MIFSLKNVSEEALQFSSLHLSENQSVLLMLYNYKEGA